MSRIVEYHTDGCPSCSAFSALMSNVELPEGCSFETVMIDDQIAEALDICSSPTIVIYGIDGNEVERFTGCVPPRVVLKAVEGLD